MDELDKIEKLFKKRRKLLTKLEQYNTSGKDSAGYAKLQKKEWKLHVKLCKKMNRHLEGALV